MKLFGFGFDKVKCGGCNWETMQLFVLAVNKKKSKGLLRSGDAGLCGSCMSELLVDEEYDIEISQKRREEWKKLIEETNRRGVKA